VESNQKKTQQCNSSSYPPVESKQKKPQKSNSSSPGPIPDGKATHLVRTGQRGTCRASLTATPPGNGRHHHLNRVVVNWVVVNRIVVIRIVVIRVVIIRVAQRVGPGTREGLPRTGAGGLLRRRRRRGLQHTAVSADNTGGGGGAPTESTVPRSIGGTRYAQAPSAHDMPWSGWSHTAGTGIGGGEASLGIAGTGRSPATIRAWMAGSNGVAATGSGSVVVGSAPLSAACSAAWMASLTHLRYADEQLLNVFTSCVYTSGVQVSPQHTTGGAAKVVTPIATVTERVCPRLELATWLLRRAATPVPVPLRQCVPQRSTRVTHQDV
jgi:hypothetical protein